MVPHTVQNRAPATSEPPQPVQNRPAGAAGGATAAGVAAAGCGVDSWAGLAVCAAVGAPMAAADVPGFGTGVPQRWQAAQRGSSMIALQRRSASARMGPWHDRRGRPRRLA